MMCKSDVTWIITESTEHCKMDNCGKQLWKKKWISACTTATSVHHNPQNLIQYNHLLTFVLSITW